MSDPALVLQCSVAAFSASLRLCSLGPLLFSAWVVIRHLRPSVIWDRPRWQWLAWQFLEHEHSFPSLLKTPLVTPALTACLPFTICITQMLGARKGYRGKNWQRHLGRDGRDTVTHLTPCSGHSAPAACQLYPTIPRCSHRQTVFTRTAQAKNSDNFAFVTQPSLKKN